jgi:hypothetical protein
LGGCNFRVLSEHSNNPSTMQDLIQQIQAKAGITEGQALVAANTAKDYIKAKVPPMFVGMVDQFFEGKFDPATAMKAAQSQQTDFMSKAKETAQDATEKITDFTKEAIDKSSDFAKQATEQMHEWAKEAGGWSEDAFNKLKDMFAGNKPSDTKRSGNGQQAGGQ